MRVLNFTIIQLTVFLTVGICLGYLRRIPLVTSACFLAASIVTLAVLYVLTRKTTDQKLWFNFATWIAMVSIGVFSVNCHNPKNKVSHYTNSAAFKENTLGTLNLQVYQHLKSSAYYHKYYANIQAIGSSTVSGKLLLRIPKTQTDSILNIGDIFIANAKIAPLTRPLNPGQFDYAEYLERQYVYHQITLNSASLHKLNQQTFSILRLSHKFKAHVITNLKLYRFKPDTLAVINALFLGERKDINSTLQSAYTNAGVVHILALSGLHIGLIVVFLNFILRPLNRVPSGRLLKIGFIVLVLWSFAFISGLSASVVRAVTMFSILSIGTHLKRPTNIYNTLASSIFIILLFNPLLLFDIGFQLSYVAVFAIVSIDPILYKLWQPKHWLLNVYWHTLTVTVSAQIGILPISLYYFHKFSGLFFISNLIIIPFLSIVIGFGILVITAAIIGVLPNFIARIFEALIHGMNAITIRISQYEAFIFENISFNILYLITAYTFIISIYFLILKRNFKRLSLALCATIFMLLSFIYTDYTLPQKQFIVFNKYRSSLIGLVSRDTIRVIVSDRKLPSLEPPSAIKDFMVKRHVKTYIRGEMQPLYALNTETLLVVDSLCVYNVKAFKPDYVLLTASPKLNLERLITTLKPKCIIADGSNYRSYIALWRSICKTHKTPFHFTGVDGAFVWSN